MTPSPNRKNVRSNKSRSLGPSKVAFCGLLVALALIFSYIEVLIPFNIGVPGVKLGIANVVIIVVLYHLDWKYAMSVNLVRVLIAGLLFTGAFGALYSLGGAILSMLIMALLKRTDIFSIVGVSIAGGVSHNLGQMLIASFMVSNLKMFAYFPVLIFSGVASGAIIGVVAYLILKRLPN